MNVRKELVAVCGKERCVTTLKTAVFRLTTCTKQEIQKKVDLREIL